jgi:hypothetical protein
VGEEMLDTCFFFLVSDYIVADHSLSNALKRMMGGCSGVLVGNFQVAEEDAMPWLLRKLNGVSGAISFSPRELMRWGLSHLHPATVANTVNYPLNHNDHTNRLFWRVDNLTLIGRFYLMHMICIKPERTNFFIGSSCDYSFIPEMCPSDNVEIIDDSDEYLVIEMQPRAHESAMLRARPQTAVGLARTLSKWTTARHRKNAETTVVFHAGELPRQLRAATEEANRFVQSVGRHLARPSPFRDHPYWRGAIAAFKEATGLRMTRLELRYALGLEHPDFTRVPLRAWLSRSLHFALLGEGPKLRSWHPRWPDHQLVFGKISSLETKDKKVLLVANTPSVFTTSLPDGGERKFRIQSDIFVRQSPEFYENLHGAFDICLIEIDETDMDKGDQLLDRIIPLMKNGATVLVSIYNRRTLLKSKNFTRLISFEAARLLRPSVVSSQYYFVKAGTLRWLTFNLIGRVVALARKRPVIGMPLLAVTGLPLALGVLVGNRLSAIKKDKPPNGIASSFLMILTVERDVDFDAYAYSSDRVRRDRNRLRDGVVDAKTLPSAGGVKLAGDIGPIVGKTRTSAKSTFS